MYTYGSIWLLKDWILLFTGGDMLRSCSYCGYIHDSHYDYEKKPQRIKKKYEKDAFQSTSAWQRNILSVI